MMIGHSFYSAVSARGGTQKSRGRRSKTSGVMKIFAARIRQIFFEFEQDIDAADSVKRSFVYNQIDVHLSPEAAATSLD